MPFIVGVGRSGTTLLRTMLDAHPALAVVHESRCLGWMARRRARYEGADGFAMERFVDDILGIDRRVPARPESWDMPPQAVRDRMLDADADDLAGAVRSMYRLYADAHGKPRAGDKTPGYLAHMEELGALLPEARFIHLVRDGRDVALSMLDVDFGGVNISHAAWLWARRIRRAQWAGERLGDRYLVVRYEDLISDPVRSVGAICTHLDLPFDPVMLRHQDAPTGVGSGFGDQRHHDHVSMPVTPGLRHWRTTMEPSQVMRFEALAGDVLDQFGYERSTASGVRLPSPLAPLQVAQGRAVAAWRARRRVRRRRRPIASPG